MSFPDRTQKEKVSHQQYQAFTSRKKQILAQLGSGDIDKSPKGFIDEHISDLCFYLNQLPHTYTTSSCSGRITVFLHGDETKGGDWLLATHDFTTEEEVGRALLTIIPKRDAAQYGLECLFPNNVIPDDVAEEPVHQLADHSTVYLRFEGAILCVETLDLLTASNFNVVCHEAGFRDSGITSITSRYIVNMRGANRLDVPLILGGKMLVNGEYVKHLTKLANDKMAYNFERIAHVWGMFKKDQYFNVEAQQQLLLEQQQQQQKKDLTTQQTTLYNNTYQVILPNNTKMIQMVKSLFRDRDLLDITQKNPVQVTTLLALYQYLLPQIVNTADVAATENNATTLSNLILTDPQQSQAKTTSLFLLNPAGNAMMNAILNKPESAPLRAVAPRENNTLIKIPFSTFIEQYLEKLEAVDITGMFQQYHNDIQSKEHKKQQKALGKTEEYVAVELSCEELKSLYDFDIVLSVYEANTVVNNAALVRPATITAQSVSPRQ